MSAPGHPAATAGTTRGSPVWTGAGVLAVLVVSAAALALAPALMPEGYSWTSHTTSESAAQGVEGAWLARLGFLLLGWAVVWLAALSRASWGSRGTALHLTFGAFMTATAAFSARSWEAGAGFDRTEDDLHSIASSVVGLSFAVGVLVVSLQRDTQRPSTRAFDLIAIVVAGVALPISMAIWSEADGVLQRVIFLIAYAWYASEALRRSRAGDRSTLSAPGAPLTPR